MALWGLDTRTDDIGLPRYANAILHGHRYRAHCEILHTVEYTCFWVYNCAFFLRHFSFKTNSTHITLQPLSTKRSAPDTYQPTTLLVYSGKCPPSRDRPLHEHGLPHRHSPHVSTPLLFLQITASSRRRAFQLGEEARGGLVAPFGGTGSEGVINARSVVSKLENVVVGLPGMLTNVSIIIVRTLPGPSLCAYQSDITEGHAAYVGLEKSQPC